MKKIIYFIFAIFLLFACSNGKPHLVNKRHFVQQKEKIQKSLDEENSSPSALIKNLPDYIKTEIESSSEEAQQNTSDNPTLSEAQPSSKETLNSLDSNFTTQDQYNSSSVSTSDGGTSSTGAGLIIAGIILLIAGVLIGVYFLAQSPTSTEPTGCLEQLAIIILLVILGAVISILGVILLIVGLIAFAAGKAVVKRRRKLKTKKN